MIRPASCEPSGVPSATTVPWKTIAGPPITPLGGNSPGSPSRWTSTRTRSLITSHADSATRVRAQDAQSSVTQTSSAGRSFTFIDYPPGADQYSDRDHRTPAPFGRRCRQYRPTGSAERAMTITLDGHAEPPACGAGHSATARFRFGRNGQAEQKCLRHAVAHRPLVRTAAVTAFVVGTVLTAIN